MNRVPDSEKLAAIKAELDNDLIPPLESERIRPPADDPLGAKNELRTVSAVNDAMRLWVMRINIARESLSPTEVLRRLLVLRAWRQTLLSDPVQKWARKILLAEREHQKEIVKIKERYAKKANRLRSHYKRLLKRALAGEDISRYLQEGDNLVNLDLEEDEANLA